MNLLLEWPFFVMSAGGMAVHALSTFFILFLLGCHKTCSQIQKCRNPGVSPSDGVYKAMTELEMRTAVWNKETVATRVLVQESQRFSIALPSVSSS